MLRDIGENLASQDRYTSLMVLQTAPILQSLFPRHMALSKQLADGDRVMTMREHFPTAVTLGTRSTRAQSRPPDAIAHAYGRDQPANSASHEPRKYRQD